MILSASTKISSKAWTIIGYPVACSAGGFGFECLAAILDSLQTGRSGKLFTSPQLSTVFLIEDGSPNNWWEYPLALPNPPALQARYPDTHLVYSLLTKYFYYS